MSYDQIMCVCGHDQEQHDWRHDWNGPCYFCECQKHREAAAHTPAEEAPTPATEMPLNQRLHDLVRHQRSALHVAGLINNDEYAELAQDHAAVKRLEDYDGVAAARELREALVRLEEAKHQSNAEWDCLCVLADQQIVASYFDKRIAELAAAIERLQKGEKT